VDRPREVPARHRIGFDLLLLAEYVLGARAFDALLGRAGDALQRGLAASLRRDGKAAFHDVDRRRDLDPEEFRARYLEPGIPVILEGAARDWECTRTWNLDFFRERYGRASVLLQELEGLSGLGVSGGEQRTTLGEAIAEMQAGKATYVRFGSVVNDHPELQRMLDLDALGRLRNPRSMGGTGHVFFLGRTGTVTPLHAALPCNLFVMVHGRKRWTLYPAASTAALRPRSTRGQYYYSSFDYADPDTAHHPALPYLDGYRFELEQGDVLYNPPYMWHHVENLTDTIGVGHRFTHLKSAARASATLFLLRLLALDPPPWRTLSALGNSRSLFSPNFKTAEKATRPALAEPARLAPDPGAPDAELPGSRGGA